MSFKGADTQQLEQIENRVKATKARLDSSLGREARVSASLRTVWLGPDSESFARTWSGVDRPALTALRSSLETIEVALRTHRTEQDTASGAGLGGGKGDSAVVRTGPDFENRVGFSTDRSWGFIGRFGSQNGFEAIYGRDGNRVTYTAKDYISLESDDLRQAVDFVATVKGKSVEMPFTMDISTGGFEGTQFIWVDDLRGTGSIPTRQTSFANLIGSDGYSSADIAKDISNGDIAQPDAIAQLSGTSTSLAASFEGGGSIFGSSGELTAQRAVEYWEDGRVVETIAVSGSSSTEAGLHLDTTVPGLSGDLKAITGAETTIEVSTVSGPNGEPVSVSYKVISHAEVGAEGAVNFAGGGAYENVTTGVLVERELTFDMTDPNVADIVRNGGTGELARHSEWATENVKVFSTEGSGSGADAIVYKIDSESESMSMIESSERGPTRSDAIQMTHEGMTAQYYDSPDGTTQKIFTAEF